MCITYVWFDTCTRGSIYNRDRCLWATHELDYSGACAYPIPY